MLYDVYYAMPRRISTNLRFSVGEVRTLHHREPQIKVVRVDGRHFVLAKFKDDFGGATVMGMLPNNGDDSHFSEVSRVLLQAEQRAGIDLHLGHQGRVMFVRELGGVNPKGVKRARKELSVILSLWDNIAREARAMIARGDVQTSMASM